MPKQYAHHCITCTCPKESIKEIMERVERTIAELSKPVEIPAGANRYAM